MVIRKLALALIAVILVLDVCQTVSAQTVQSAPSVQWWNSIIAPTISGIIVIFVAFMGIKFDWMKITNQELIKKRISVYDSAVPKLNDLLCFFLIIGSWKELEPTLIIKKKRELDQIMHIYGYLFSPSVFEQYNKLIHLCFKTFIGIGKDACLRADLRKIERNWGTKWNSQWNSLFVEEKEVTSMKEIKREYNYLINLMASEIGARKNRPSIWEKLKSFSSR